MFLIDYEQLGWWYWLAIVCLLTAGVAGYPHGHELAMAVAAGQLVHFALRERSVSVFPVQVRFWYLALLLLALPEPLRFIDWIPVIGTWARLFTGYCTLARLVALLPWNRSQPLSWALVRRMILSRPVRGSVLQGLADRAAPAIDAKALRGTRAEAGTER